MAHIVQRGTRWTAQVEKLGVRKRATFDTHEQAAEWASSLEAEIRAAQPYGEMPAIELSVMEYTDLYVKAKERARQRGIPFNLDRKSVMALYAKSGGHCQVSGIAFNRFRPAASTKRPWYPSLDRIDSSRPYDATNCRFVCVAVNFAMGEWGEWALRAIVGAMSIGKTGNLCPGTEAAPYQFPALSAVTTPRQKSRKNQRAGNKTPRITHQQQTHELPQ